MGEEGGGGRRVGTQKHGVGGGWEVSRVNLREKRKVGLWESGGYLFAMQCTMWNHYSTVMLSNVQNLKFKSPQIITFLLPSINIAVV